MGASFGTGGVASGKAEWCSRRCLEYGSSRGQRHPREEDDLGNG